VLIYKILLPAQWDGFTAAGEFDGSPDDHRDGFIHFSVRAQLPGTAARYFADQPELVLAAVEAEPLGAALRFEPGGTGELFPHLYATLPLDAVVANYRLAGAPAVAQWAESTPPIG
jgi:uncharacterized protein (DUF952 family)